jgi:PEGA domain-containing protein
MADRPSNPDEAWERSMLKGLDAFLTHEHQRGPSPSTPAPPPDSPDKTDETPRAEPDRSASEIEAMLTLFEQHADPPADPKPSAVERAPFSEARPQDITGPVLVHDSEPRKRALLSAIGEGFGGASRYASGLGSRTKDYLGTAGSNFTRPVFKEPARRRGRKKKPLRIDAREAAVIALSIVGLAEVGWIGWRVTNPPRASVVGNRGARSSDAATVEPIATPPAPAPRAKSTPPPVARAKTPGPAPASATSATPPAGVAKDVTPAPEVTATAGKGSGWVTIPLSPPVEVFERGHKLASRGGRVTLPAGRHDLQFTNKALGIDTRRTVDVAANTEAPVALDVQPGSVNVNALPWASVSIDGAIVGDTPLANLALAAGPHDVVFKHPELGERRLRVNVTAGTPLRVSTDLRSNAK